MPIISYTSNYYLFQYYYVTTNNNISNKLKKKRYKITSHTMGIKNHFLWREKTKSKILINQINVYMYLVNV